MATFREFPTKYEELLVGSSSPRCIECKFADMEAILRECLEVEDEEYTSPDLVLSVQHSDHKNRKTEVEKPCVVGYFSIDKERNYMPGLSMLKYMTRKTGIETNVSLNRGKFEKWNKNNDNKFPFFDYLLEHRKMLDEMSSDGISEVGFITERSTLMDIFNLRHKPKKAFVTKLFKGNIYIRSVRNPHEVPDILSLHGHKFEQYMLSDDPKTTSNIDELTVASEEFTCVLEMALSKHNILYSSETDGILAEADDINALVIEQEDEAEVAKDLENRSFVRVMTSAKHYKDVKFRRFKMPQIWPKVFFSRSDKIIIGKKQDETITKLWGFSSKGLNYRRIGNWNYNAHFRKMDAFFTFIKDNYLREIVHEPHDSVKNIKPIELIFLKPKDNMTVVKCDEVPQIGNIRIVRKVMDDFIIELSNKYEEDKKIQEDQLTRSFNDLNISSVEQK